MKIILLTVLIFAAAMGIMAIGVILSGRCLRGSCGGENIRSTNGEEVTCGVCGRKKPVDTDLN